MIASKTVAAFAVAMTWVMTAHSAPVISTGHVSGTKDTSTIKRVSGSPCFWSVPGSLQMVNLQAALSVKVVIDKTYGSGRNEYVTQITFDRYSEVRLTVPATERADYHIAAIATRLEQCAN